jgi:hypothetical protein
MVISGTGLLIKLLNSKETTMNKILFSMLILLISTSVLADITDCQNLYVGRIEVSKGSDLSGVVFLNSPSNSSGSYWVRFTGWSESEKKSALSLLMAAKMSQHGVNLKTEEVNGCDIAAGSRVASKLFLANNK